MVRSLRDLSEGDLTKTIDKHYEGSFGELKKYTNDTLAKLARVITAQQLLVQAANQGDFQARVDLTDLHGFQQEMGQGLNQLVTTTGSSIADVVRVMKALSAGDRRPDRSRA